MSQAGLSAGLVSILLLVYRVLLWLNHRRIASRCCGRTIDVEIDIAGLSGTTPPPENKNEPIVKDVGSNNVGTATSNVGPGSQGDSHQTNSGGTVSGPQGLSVKENQGSLPIQTPPPGVRPDSGANAVPPGKGSDGLPLPEHL